ncbi:hypothetical protein DL96DRAFT_1591020 [Flagelloscypha sp. PMI_526]|nr:hypothetical protein DL96DRAFT_1591020 [Flagelloscypha sp. PMI_526]
MPAELTKEALLRRQVEESEQFYVAQSKALELQRKLAKTQAEIAKWDLAHLNVAPSKTATKRKRDETSESSEPETPSVPAKRGPAATTTKTAERKPKEKLLKDPNAPKKATPAFLLYQNSVRKDYKAENPDLSNKDLIAAISQRWNSFTPEQKQDEYLADKERYERAMAAYGKKTPEEIQANIDKAQADKKSRGRPSQKGKESTSTPAKTPISKAPVSKAAPAVPPAKLSAMKQPALPAKAKAPTPESESESESDSESEEESSSSEDTAPAQKTAAPKKPVATTSKPAIATKPQVNGKKPAPAPSDDESEEESSEEEEEVADSQDSEEEEVKEPPKKKNKRK